jgi:hypothetical protein
VFVKLASLIAYQRLAQCEEIPIDKERVAGAVRRLRMHMLNATLKHNDDNGDIRCEADVLHCFLNLPRVTVLYHLFTIDEFSDIFHLYGEESAMLLHMGRDKSAEVIWSLQGVAQGCVSADAVCVTDKRHTPAQQAAMAAAPNCWRLA